MRRRSTAAVAARRERPGLGGRQPLRRPARWARSRRRCPWKGSFEDTQELPRSRSSAAATRELDMRVTTPDCPTPSAGLHLHLVRSATNPLELSRSRRRRRARGDRRGVHRRRPLLRDSPVVYRWTGDKYTRGATRTSPIPATGSSDLDGDGRSRVPARPMPASAYLSGRSRSRCSRSRSSSFDAWRRSSVVTPEFQHAVAKNDAADEARVQAAGRTRPSASACAPALAAVRRRPLPARPQGDREAQAPFGAPPRLARQAESLRRRPVRTASTSATCKRPPTRARTLLEPAAILFQPA